MHCKCSMMVYMLSSSFCLLAIGLHELSQAEKEITPCQDEQTMCLKVTYLHSTYIMIYNRCLSMIVYDQNLVSVSATETKIRFWYRYRSLNFFYLNRNFLHILFLKFFSRFSALFWIFPRLYTGIMKLVWKLSKNKIRKCKIGYN